MAGFKNDDYVEVPERIAAWYSKFPKGRIVCKVLENSETRVTVKASAYRTDDPNEPPAGVGHSSLGIPGKTPFTKDSELENAETSAAGRALVMAGIPSKHVASGNEVRSKKDDAGSRPAPAPASTTPEAGATRSGGSGANRQGVSKGSPAPARTQGEYDQGAWDSLMEGK